MAINLQIYSNAYGTTKTVTVDFLSEVAALSDDSTVNDTVRSFFKFTTAAKDTDGLAYTPRVVTSLSDLAIAKQAQSAANVTSAYTNVNAMVTDYLYDYINGHTANQWDIVIAKKAPMKFST